VKSSISKPEYKLDGNNLVKRSNENLMVAFRNIIWNWFF